MLTLQDDNIGSLPQLATPQARLLLNEISRQDWRGFFTRHWPIGDLDPIAAYLSKASWNSGVRVPDIYRDYFSNAFAAESHQDLLSVMGLLEDSTVILDLDFLGLLFPTMGTMLRYVEQKSRVAEGLLHVRAMYAQARMLLSRVDIAADRADARLRRDYLSARIEFSIEAINEIELLCTAGLKKADGHEEYRRLLRAAADTGHRALRPAASCVRDDSDQATLAAYHHTMVRQIEELLEGAQSQ